MQTSLRRRKKKGYLIKAKCRKRTTRNRQSPVHHHREMPTKSETKLCNAVVNASIIVVNNLNPPQIKSNNRQILFSMPQNIQPPNPTALFNQLDLFPPAAIPGLPSKVLIPISSYPALLKALFSLSLLLLPPADPSLRLFVW